MQITSIMPIKPIQTLDMLGQAEKSSGSSSASLPFKSMFEEAIQDVKDSQSAVDAENYKLATGQSDNVHEVELAATKATASVELLIQLRNKALDAYNEVMRISV